jgi:hypothetical protein
MGPQDWNRHSSSKERSNGANTGILPPRVPQPPRHNPHLHQTLPSIHSGCCLPPSRRHCAPAEELEDLARGERSEQGLALAAWVFRDLRCQSDRARHEDGRIVSFGQKAVEGNYQVSFLLFAFRVTNLLTVVFLFCIKGRRCGEDPGGEIWGRSGDQGELSHRFVPCGTGF